MHTSSFLSWCGTEQKPTTSDNSLHCGSVPTYFRYMFAAGLVAQKNSWFTTFSIMRPLIQIREKGKDGGSIDFQASIILFPRELGFYFWNTAEWINGQYTGFIPVLSNLLVQQFWLHRVRDYWWILIYFKFSWSLFNRILPGVEASTAKWSHLLLCIWLYKRLHLWRRQLWEGILAPENLFISWTFCQEPTLWPLTSSWGWQLPTLLTEMSGVSLYIWPSPLVHSTMSNGLFNICYTTLSSSVITNCLLSAGLPHNLAWTEFIQVSSLCGARVCLVSPCWLGLSNENDTLREPFTAVLLLCFFAWWQQIFLDKGSHSFSTPTSLGLFWIQKSHRYTGSE